MVTKKSGLIVVVILLGLLAEVDIVKAQFQDMFRIGTRYLDDTPFNPDTDILRLDESLYLNIYATEGFYWESSFGYYWALVCDPSLASITGGEAGPDVGYVGWGASGPEYLDRVPGDGRWGYLYPYEPPLYGPGRYLDNFLYSPQCVGDVTVSFWHMAEDLGPYGVVDSIVIRQIPEPMTVILVALGGLFVLRRR